ncbi:MAG: beta-lactamase [Labilithrix sp.]|nr:beta-lactamase [Labilithrix sp.]
MSGHRARLLVLAIALLGPLAPGCRAGGGTVVDAGADSSASGDASPGAVGAADAAADVGPAMEAGHAADAPLPAPDVLAAAFKGTAARGFVAATMRGSDGVPVRALAPLGRGDARLAPDAPVPIASFTKLWTAVAALQLVAAHRLELSMTIAEVLPALARRAWADSTLAELMSHTSRVPEFDEASGYFRKRDVSFEDPVAALERYVPRSTEKRGVFKYRNAEYAIVGAMVAARAGKPLADVLQGSVFGPAKMTRSGLLVGSAEPAVDLHALGVVRAQNFFAAGAGYSTADDLLSFFEALGDATLLDAEQKKLLFDGQKSRGYGALGCWAYPFETAPGATTLLVERQGALGDMKLFAAFAPEQRRAVVAWSSPSLDFDHPYLGHGVGFQLARLVVVR